MLINLNHHTFVCESNQNILIPNLYDRGGEYNVMVPLVAYRHQTADLLNEGQPCSTTHPQSPNEGRNLEIEFPCDYHQKKEDETANISYLLKTPDYRFADTVLK